MSQIEREGEITEKLKSVEIGGNARTQRREKRAREGIQSPSGWVCLRDFADAR